MKYYLTPESSCEFRKNVAINVSIYTLSYTVYIPVEGKIDSSSDQERKKVLEEFTVSAERRGSR